MQPAARIGLALGVFVGCTPQGVSETPVSDAPTQIVSPANVVAPKVATADAGHPEPDRPEPTVLIDDAQMLASLDLRFGPTVMGVEAADTLALRKSRRFRQLAHRVRGDALPGWWLRSSNTELELAAVVNRLDRQDMLPGTCGETRLVYRLVHHAKTGPKQLPVGLNVLFVQQDSGDGCQSVAQSWRVEDPSMLREDGGPLSPAALSFDNVRAVESNVRKAPDDTVNELQIHLRNPEARWDREQWTTGVLEFNPDTMYKGRGWRRVAELMMEPAMREAVFEGTASTGDRGIRYPEWDATPGRTPSDMVEHMPADGDYAPFADRAAYLKRMRSLTCGGCHATRAVDGFHVAAGTSSHLQDENLWRTAYVTAVAEGREPNRVRLPVFGGD